MKTNNQLFSRHLHQRGFESFPAAGGNQTIRLASYSNQEPFPRNHTWSRAETVASKSHVKDAQRLA